ncbi:hypothetical protein ACGF0J_03275 [Nonomuraea sp. NPDC047897]|uniref:hypothetical protein n=1 Tax=Nonomuraea sp. NPDC047897 TaxID=3364346 RepID=UPI0037150251
MRGTNTARKAPLIVALILGLAGCSLADNPVVRWAAPAKSPTSPSSASSSPPAPRESGAAPGPDTPAPSPSPSSPSPSSPSSSSPAPSSPAASIRLTVADARKEAAAWVARHNELIKDPDWWDEQARADTLFAEGTRHEVVIDRGHVSDGKKGRARRPIRLTGKQTYYVPRDQPDTGEWFMLQATYRGQDRAHLLAFWRARGESFKLAAKTPLHYGQRVPAPRLDAEGYASAAPMATGGAIAREYMIFWDYDQHKKAGKNGYRLAEDNYSRRAYATVSKGVYAGYQSFGTPWGFVTRDGGSVFLFSMLNHPKSIWQVLTVATYVRKGSKEIQELAGDWYA